MGAKQEAEVRLLNAFFNREDNPDHAQGMGSLQAASVVQAQARELVLHPVRSLPCRVPLVICRPTLRAASLFFTARTCAQISCNAGKQWCRVRSVRRNRNRRAARRRPLVRTRSRNRNRDRFGCRTCSIRVLPLESTRFIIHVTAAGTACAWHATTDVGWGVVGMTIAFVWLPLELGDRDSRSSLGCLRGIVWQ